MIDLVINYLDSDKFLSLMQAGLLFIIGFLAASLLSRTVYKVCLKRFSPHHASLSRRLVYWLVLAFGIGAGIPLLVNAPDSVGLMMLVVGSLISVIFVALAFLSSILTRDKAKGIGIAIMTWLFFALLFDGIVLFLLFQLADYPIEHTMVAMTALSPIDLARIQILMHLDVSAMMGYTGAIFQDFFGTAVGLIASFLLLCLWAMVPFFISLKKFNKKDL